MPHPSRFSGPSRPDMRRLYRRASVGRTARRSGVARPPSCGGPRRPARGGAAVSYEARRFGVHSAMPSTTAMRLCAELVFVPPRVDVYRAVSRRIHAIFADCTTLIEPLSLDEAYLDVTDNLRGLSTASATAKEIRARIFNETGLTASAASPTTSFLPSWRPRNASRTANSSSRRRWGRTSSRYCRWRRFTESGQSPRRRCRAQYSDRR